jgi:hypothetical protein
MKIRVFCFLWDFFSIGDEFEAKLMCVGQVMDFFKDLITLVIKPRMKLFVSRER